MSKLTDKINGLLELAENGHYGDKAVLLDRSVLRNILADVRELENDLTNGAAYENGYADGQDETEAAAATAIRYAKREAYEHVLDMLDKVNVGMVENACRNSIKALDALDTEGNSDE